MSQININKRVPQNINTRQDNIDVYEYGNYGDMGVNHVNARRRYI
jgi:hypothetical protein